MPHIVAIGAVTLDITLKLSRTAIRSLGIEPGTVTQVADDRIETVRSGGEALIGELPPPVSGGSAGNTIDLIARAGVESSLIAVGGDDALGRCFRDDCARSGLKLETPLRPGLVTGYNLCFFDEEGESTIVWTPGANATISPAAVDEELIRGADLVIIDGFVLGFGAEGPAVVERAASIAASNGIPYLVTLASVETVERHRELIRSLLPDSFAAVGNAAQAAALVSVSPASPFERTLSEISAAGIDAIVTMGAHGAFASFDGNRVFADASVVPVVDTTGAGDAFLAGFILARLRRRSLEDSLDAGCFIAGEAVRHVGGRIPERVNVPELVEAAMARE